MTFTQITDILRSNGYSLVVAELEKRTFHEGYGGNNIPTVRNMYASLISSYFTVPTEIGALDVILSPDFAFMKAIANVLLDCEHPVVMGALSPYEITGES